MIDIAGKIRQLHTLHEAEMPEFSEDGQDGTAKKSAICEQVQSDLAKLVQDIEKKMSESSKEENES